MMKNIFEKISIRMHVARSQTSKIIYHKHILKTRFEYTKPNVNHKLRSFKFLAFDQKVELLYFHSQKIWHYTFKLL